MNLTRQVALGLYPNRNMLEIGINRLKLAGFAPEQISVVDPSHTGTREERDAVGRDVAKTSKISGIAGAIVGIAIGALALSVPGVSTATSLGWSGPLILGAIIGGGVGALLGSYIGLDSSSDELKVYEERRYKNAALASVECSDDDHLHTAERILAETGAEEIYHRP